MKILAVIPARGGSVGIPHKNIVPLGGSPLIAHTIRAARQAGLPDEAICVSTDDPKIIEAATAEGLKVPFVRPAELATSTCGTREVLLHALGYYRAQGFDPDTILLLQPTSPFRNGNHIREAVAQFESLPDADMVVSVKSAATNPYLNCYEVRPDGTLEISKGSGTIPRRQDAPEVWEMNGAIYVIRTASLEKGPIGLFAARYMYPMGEAESLDIDTPLDLAVAEMMLERGLVTLP